MEHRKIIDKICKCLRLSESGNPYEAAMALRQAHRLMRKYRISEDLVREAIVAESVVDIGQAFNHHLFRDVFIFIRAGDHGPRAQHFFGHQLFIGHAGFR